MSACSSEQRSMRVLFWSGTFWPNIGGVEVLAAKLLPALRGRGYEFCVITSKSSSDLPDQAQYSGIPIHRLPFANNASGTIDHILDVRKKVADIKKSFAPDLIHINAVGVEDLFHLTTRNVCHAPLLVTLHGKWPHRANAIVREVLSHADWVAGCSAAMLEEGRRLAPEIVTRSSIIYNAADPPRVVATRVPVENARCLCVGRLAPDKGFDVAVAAFRSVIDQIPHARLVIAGDGPDRPRLQKQAAECGINHAVDFLGWVTPARIPDLINSATLLLIPSREESFGLVALEAALMCRPVIASRVGGLPEIVLHGKTGLLVQKEDTDGLASAIALLLKKPDTIRRMGVAGRARAQEFTWQNHLDSYDALYRKLTRDQPHRFSMTASSSQN